MLVLFTTSKNQYTQDMLELVRLRRENNALKQTLEQHRTIYDTHAEAQAKQVEQLLGEIQGLRSEAQELVEHAKDAIADRDRYRDTYLNAVNSVERMAGDMQCLVASLKTL